jgi:hypothetical protein
VRSVEPLPVPKRDVLSVDVHPIIERLVDGVSHIDLLINRSRNFGRPSSTEISPWKLLGTTIHHEADLKYHQRQNPVNLKIFL